jgi:hypothetical protein
MMKTSLLLASLTLIGVVGCDKASSTAPGTNPNKPSEVQKLTIVVKDTQTITQDRTDEISVGVNRDHFKEPVTLDVKKLPSGVTLVTRDLTIPADKSTITLTIKAAPDATPVEGHMFEITGSAKGLPEVTNHVKLTVKAK